MANAGQIVKRSVDFSDSSLTDGEREERFWEWVAGRVVKGVNHAWQNRNGR